MQRDQNLLHINNGQQIDAIQMSYGKTGVVYTGLSDLLEVTPHRMPIISRTRIGFNSNYNIVATVIVVTAHITVVHGSFNWIFQLGPICTPTYTCQTPLAVQRLRHFL